MKRKSIEAGGVACGICSISLQKASLSFGIADVTHGILGVATLISMIIKKESDFIYPDPRITKDKVSGYSKFVESCPLWVLHYSLAAFILQIILGILLCLGASNRSYILCSLWTLASVIASPLTPMSYCILGLGRVFEWATVGEFIWKMNKEERQLIMDYKNGKNHGGIYITNSSNGNDEDTRVGN